LQTVLEVIRDEPKNREALLLLGQVHCRRREWDDGVKVFRTLEPFTDGESIPMYLYSVCLYRVGRHDEASELFRRAQPGLPDSPTIRTYRKLILGKKG
jgi:hypothetical protein